MTAKLATDTHRSRSAFPVETQLMLTNSFKQHSKASAPATSRDQRRA